MAATDLAFPDQEDVRRTISEAAPNHYILKINQFSQLTKQNIDKYNSVVFQAGGHKWRLALHPNGNNSKGVTDHISLYLVLTEADSLGPGAQIRAVFRLFLLDQNKDAYLCVQDASENGRRFHRMMPEWGFDKFIRHADFKDPAKGYLVDDTCVLGAEVYVRQESLAVRGECLSMLKDAVTKRSWRIDNFSSVKDYPCVDCSPFTAADKSWKVQLYPGGKGSGAGSYISLYLTLAEPENLPPGFKLYAEFTLRIVDQIEPLYNKFATANYWFSASNLTCGWPTFISKAYFNMSGAGFLVQNKCIVEADVTVKCVANLL